MDPNTQLARVLAFHRHALKRTQLEGVLESCLTGGVDLVAADRGFLLLYDEGEINLVGPAHNLDRSTIDSARFEPLRAIAEQVLASGEPFLGSSPAPPPEAPMADAPRAVVVVPLTGRERVFGALYLDRLPYGGETFGVGVLRRLQTFTELTSPLIGLHRQLIRLEAERAALQTTATRLEQDVTEQAKALDQTKQALNSSKRALRLRYDFHNIIGRSPVMQRLFDTLSQIMNYPVPVLITGESGTGKELVARALHHGGPNADSPFLAINCAAVPENLLESELFGFKRGAFTGATRDRDGLFLAAGRGTVFLDEIGEMPALLQAKLLRVLQEREVRPLGAQADEPVEARILAATNRDLAQEAIQGNFREDLYYRLNVVEVQVPPLRTRLEDLPDLAQHFLTGLTTEFGLPPKRLSPEALRRLTMCRWPGNVRQLENVVRSSAIFAPNALIEPHDLRLPDQVMGGAPTPVSTARAMTRPPQIVQPTIESRAEWEAHERAELLQALTDHRWNKAKTARSLGISRRNLYRKLARYGIEGT